MSDKVVRQRLKGVFELFELGLSLRIQKIKEKSPNIKPEDLNKRLLDWLLRRGEDNDSSNEQD